MMNLKLFALLILVFYVSNSIQFQIVNNVKSSNFCNRITEQRYSKLNELSSINFPLSMAVNVETVKTQSIFEKYVSTLKSKPLITKSITSAVGFALGDFLAQKTLVKVNHNYFFMMF